MRRLAWIAPVVITALASAARAQERRVEIHFTPVARAQIAVWIESADGSLFRTIRLTERTAFYGIGNRPGALQMNSAFHWPYGRREGVLPVWAHRRYRATGVLFPRVIFAGRVSEGNASNAGSPGEVTNTRDEAYCLSFTPGDEALDAMACASVFMSNKGRYLTEADVAAGYAEPWEEPGGGSGRMRPLALGSLYPPRQDLGECVRCLDHEDVRRYVRDARAVMPELDAVTMATPPGEVPFVAVFDVPPEWPDGEYVVWVEVNVEGDYAPGWDPTRYPTPRQPSGRWDSWAIGYGYPYRGQPSVVYRLPIAIGSAGGEWSTATPAGYGDLHGIDGEIRAMDGTIRDDPETMPGSGADRLRLQPEGWRLRAVVPETNVCERSPPPPDCGRECGDERPCGTPLICGPEGTCVGLCDVAMQPGLPLELALETHPERRHSHRWARMRFRVPESARGISRYEVRVSTEPIVDAATYAAARPAKAATLEDEALVVPIGQAAGALVELDIGGLSPETHYWVGVRAYDSCHAAGPIAVAEIETTPIYFTTVSPCFVATAAYGTPLDARIGVLRRFRDRHLRSSAFGRALVALYEALSPPLARWIAEDEDRRAVARALIHGVIVLLSNQP
jgi:hypothetical protein